jgi:hypothetical protein
VGLGAISIAAVVYTSHWGTYALSTVNGTDWPWHASQVEAFFTDASRDPGFSFVGQMARYPIGAYVLTAALSRITGIGPLAMIQLLGGCFTAFAALAVACIVGLRVRERASPLSVLFGLLVLGFLAWSGAGMRGLLGGNFYFTQLISICVALWALLPLQRWQSRPLLLSLWVFFIGALVLPNIHLSVALWFLVSGGLVLVTNKESFRYAFPLAVICAAALFLNPSFKAMVGISQIDGGLSKTH